MSSTRFARAVRRVLIASIAGLIGPAAISQAPAPSARISVARFTADKQLIRPADLEEWVFVGTALGMDYAERTFDPASPGQFQVVTMEPQAYRYFKANGRFAPGSMFLLQFYAADARKRSINQTGFVQAELAAFEIHLLDKEAFGSDGRAFYVFRPDATQANPIRPGNDCVKCHVKHGVLDGTFTQFYPELRKKLPKDVLERALEAHIPESGG